MRFLREPNSPKHTHGLTHHPLYHVWYSMMRRCHHPAHKYYASYGGRGITVCERWMSLAAFVEDMGGSYVSGKTLERVDNNDGYHPGNCIWAGASEQQNNKRSNVVVTIDGCSQTISEWMRSLGVKKPTYRKRINRGLSPVEALLTPVDEYYRHKSSLRAKEDDNAYRRR